MARTDGLVRLLDRLATLDDTPLGRRARSLRDSLPSCPTLEAQASSGRLSDAAALLACEPSRSRLSRLHELRADRDLAFALPLEAGVHAIGTAAIAESGEVALEISLPASALHGARRLLLPGETPPGPGVLAAAGAILQARLRPEGGVDLASLVADDGQAARLFRLKSDLFSGTVLDGTWEIAVYVPAEGRAMPDAALALGFDLKTPAIAAMERFVREIQETWPVHRSFFEVGGAEGACLLDLAVLPELAPCFVATERALVVGWNPGSVRRALAPGARRAEGGAVFELARITDVDASLARAAALESPGVTWPWRRVRAEGERRDGVVQLRVVLEAGAST